MSGTSRYALIPAPSTSASWASRSAGCNSPAAIATRARTVSGQRRVPAGCRREGLVGAAAGDGEIPVCQRGLGTPDAPHRRLRTNDDSHVLVGGLARVLRGRSVPGGQGGVSQDRVPECREPSAKLRGALKCRLSRRSRRGRLTLACECNALASEADHAPDLVMRRVGLGGHLAELCDGSG